jgi:hypothetical protein
MIDDDRFSVAGTPEQKRLLGSARQDAPPPESRERLLAALGLAPMPLGPGHGADAGNVSLPSPPLAGPSAGSLSASLGAPASGLMSAVALKWLAVASLSFGVGLGGGFAIRDGLKRPLAHHPQVSAASPAEVDGKALAATSKEEAEHPLAQVRTEATLPLPPPRVSPGPSAPETERALDLEREIALVAKARAAQKAQDPRACLSYLAMREQLAKSSVLQPEAAVLRIEALRSLGQLDLARGEALRFFHAYPDSPLVKRIMGLLPDDPLSTPETREPEPAR